MALLSKGSSLISGGIWRLTLARRRRTGRGGGGGAVSASSPCLAQPLVEQPPLFEHASLAGALAGGAVLALQHDVCAASSQPPVAQASLVTGCDALQHVSAGGGSLLPSMLLYLHRSALLFISLLSGC